MCLSKRKEHCTIKEKRSIIKRMNFPQQHMLSAHTPTFPDSPKTLSILDIEMNRATRSYPQQTDESFGRSIQMYVLFVFSSILSRHNKIVCCFPGIICWPIKNPNGQNLTYANQTNQDQAIILQVLMWLKVHPNKLSRIMSFPCFWTNVWNWKLKSHCVKSFGETWWVGIAAIQYIFEFWRATKKKWERGLWMGMCV